MRPLLIVLLLFASGFLSGKSAHAMRSDEFLEADQAFQLTSRIDKASAVQLTWKIAQGYSLYHHKFKFVSLTPGIEIGNPAFPQGIRKQDKTFGSVEIFNGELNVDLPIIRHGSNPSRMNLSIGYQGCADESMCYMPVTKVVTLDLPGSDNTPADQYSSLFGQLTLITDQDSIAETINNHSMAFIFASFLGFGILLAFTPCVFPMIPIVSGIIIGQGSGITTSRAFTLSLSYVLASAFTYMLFGIIAGLFGSNLQVFFQEPAVIAGFSALFIGLALSMFGVFTLQIPTAIQTRISIVSARQKGGNWLGAAIMGVLSTLAVGPCVTAPLAGALIYIGKTGDAVLGGLALFALGLGMGIPLLLVGTSAGKFMPKSGVWLAITKLVFGMGLLAVAVWLLGRILPPAVTLQLWALLLLIPVFYFGWKRLWKTVAGVIVIYGSFLFIGVFTQQERDYMAALCNTALACEAPASLQFHKIKTAQELVEMITKAHNEKRWLMFDLYADWCVSCQEMKQLTFSDVNVKAAVSDFILVQADVTKNNSDDYKLLSDLNLIGPPTVLFFGPDKVERKNKRIIGFMNSGDFLRRIASLKLD